MALWQERALPDLSKNIQCGNSLIGPDFYNDQQLSFLAEEEQYRINAFDWQNSFPEVFSSACGFDVVIGNPPYIRIQALQEWAPLEVEFYKQRYISAQSGNYDIYLIFVEKGLSLLRKTGCLGYILPSKFFATNYGENLRKIISDNQAINKIVDFGHMQVFEQATTYTCLLFLRGLHQTTFEYAKINDPHELSGNLVFHVKQNKLSSTQWVFEDDISLKLSNKIKDISKPLGELPTRIGRGSSSGADKIFILKYKQDKYFTRQGEEIGLEENILRIPIYATDFGRYRFFPRADEVIIFPYKIENEFTV